jgi:hypothetical protein
MANWLEQGMARTALLSLQEDGITIPDTALLSAESVVSNALHSAHSQLPEGMIGETTTTPTPTL